MADETEELVFDVTEAIETEEIPEGLEGLEAEFYKDYKFRVIKSGEVLNTDEIVKRGFRLDRTFIENVVTDEVLFSQTHQQVKRKHKMRTHADLRKIYPDTPEGKEQKDKDKEEIFDKFMREKSLGSKSSQDDIGMFEDTFELTKRAWKKQGGFSSDDFYRFARNRASDPELVKMYKAWFETLFSTAAMLCWEALRLRANPEVFEIIEQKAPEIVEKAAVEEKKPLVVLSPRMKVALLGMGSGLAMAGFFYFALHILLTDTEEEKKIALKKPSLYENVVMPNLAGKKWAKNPQNDLILLAEKKVFKKKYSDQEPEKVVYYPVLQGAFESYVGFRGRLDEDQEKLESCGYRVVLVKGPEAELLEKEGRHREYLKTCQEHIASLSQENAKPPVPGKTVVGN